MRLLHSTALAFGLGTLVYSSVAAQQAASAPLRVQRQEILDRNGFEKPLVAYTLFVPSGWRGEGGVEYPMNDPCGLVNRLRWRATAPDGIGTLEITPEEKWSAANFPVPGNQCPMSQASGAKQYLEWWVQRNRRGARVMDFRPRPDMLKGMESLNTTNPQIGLRSWVDAGEILIAYDLNGKQVREAISVTAFFTHTRMPSLGNNPPMELLQASTGPGFAMRMPDGALNFKMIEALRQSIRAAPEWNARMRQANDRRHQATMNANRQMAADNMREIQKRGEIMANTRAEIIAMQMGTWQSRNESMDRQQRETIESIRGVETYNDPKYGGTIQLSNQYQHAWQLRDGSYVLTDDVNFDPNRAFGVQGQLLQRTQ
jgi:hypothetical protein